MPLNTAPGATARTLVVIGTAPHRLIVDPGVVRCECGLYSCAYVTPFPAGEIRAMLASHDRHARNTESVLIERERATTAPQSPEAQFR